LMKNKMYTVAGVMAVVMAVVSVLAFALL
jgi:hypothetical protein